MTDRGYSSERYDLCWALMLLALVITFCSRLLFTDQIVRASDLITQFFWGAREASQQGFSDYLTNLANAFQASWELYEDGGRTLEGGWNAIRLLLHRDLILKIFPFPSSIAWLAVLSLAWGGIGTFYYCRKRGISQPASLIAGLLFALCSENLTLLNAGHIQKIETIAWFPWVLLAFETALRRGELFHYLLTGLLLAVQFFNMHWQISFYSCLAVGLYWLFFILFRTKEQEVSPKGRGFGRNLTLATVMLIFFFSTVAISFAPLYSWSKQSERSGGMGGSQGMSWSMPPEELATFLVPGLFGLSRQEAGDRPEQGEVYYWGRMYFTQTSDYLGLLPWFMIPLALLKGKERIRWFLAGLMLLTAAMALGKYSPLYRLMFDHLPGFSTFRVPKMILFLFAFAAAVLTGDGLQLLLDRRTDAERKEKVWLGVASVMVLMIGIGWLFTLTGQDTLFQMLRGIISAPTRYQQGGELATMRLWFMQKEAGVAFCIAVCHLLLLFAWHRRWLRTALIVPLLGLLLLSDLWRVNRHFMALTAAPVADKQAAKSDTVRFLEKRIGLYRMQPFNEQESHYYSDYKLPALASYVTVSEKRYRQYLDNLYLATRMPDIMNLKYLVMPQEIYRSAEQQYEGKYLPVFHAENGSVVLENSQVMPKGWLVSNLKQIDDADRRLTFMAGRGFDPAAVAVVESPPPFPLSGQPDRNDRVTMEHYSPNRIRLSVSNSRPALLVLGEKYYRWWYASDNGAELPIVPVNHILRGVYLQGGEHQVEFRFDPLPFKIGRYLTIGSLLLFVIVLVRQCKGRGKRCRN